MPRHARILLPDTPHHLVHRGHNRKRVFNESADFQYYLSTLKEWSTALGVSVHAWCLMTNHVHLVVNPGVRTESISKLMKRLAGRQTRYVNALEGRSGTLWEGRYKSSPIQSEAYLLQCCRYVELNPVRAKMVARAQDYPWSSYRSKIGLEASSLLSPDPLYLGFKSPREDYQAFVEQGVPTQEQKFIQERVQRRGLTGDSAFLDEVELQTGIRVEYRKRGRPRKERK